MKCVLLLLICSSCSSNLWTKEQVISAYDSDMPGIWCPKEVASNQFVVITWDGKYLKP